MKRIVLILSLFVGLFLQAIASTPLDVKIEWKFIADGGNHRYGILRFVPQVDGYEEYFSQISGIGLGVDDEPNEYFLTTEAAEAYYLADSHWITQVVSNMNMDTGVTDYVFRDLIRVPGHVNDEDKLIRASVSTVNGRLATAETKLAGITAGATANDTDANLKARANHTGTQAISTVSGLQSALDGKASTSHSHAASDVSDFTEASQDAIGGAISSEFVYNDAGNAVSLRTKSFSNAPGRSLTTGTGATGFLVSSTRDSVVNYSASIITTATINGSTAGSIVLEICATNSATAGDWVEIGRMTNGQNITLALALSSTNTQVTQIGGVVPAGYYAKLRQITTNGTPAFSISTQQEVLL